MGHDQADNEFQRPSRLTKNINSIFLPKEKKIGIFINKRELVFFHRSLLSSNESL